MDKRALRSAACSLWCLANGRRMSSSTLHEPAINVAAGVPMPMLGFGTWQIRGREAYDAVRTALDVGYRHVDTAALYENEAEVGRAIADSGDRKSTRLNSSHVAISYA